MSLSNGTRLGAYEITGSIGAGGMGEVYRAHDTKLGREVAIKTLPAALASDKDRLARFEREAKLLAALNHAHIASVHSLDEHEGTLYLAMELVAGETLEETLKSGALSIRDAIELAAQIAVALEAAHEKSVIHRDLKPANIMITPNGVIKVLDFGLAKVIVNEAAEGNPLNSPALSIGTTQAGMILGTAAYMSPEQARGQPVDKRADIFAFGAILYEMLTGRPAFDGGTASDILGAVLRLEPDWSALPRDLPDSLQRILERCLQKDPRRRQRDAGDIRLDLDKALKEIEATPSSRGGTGQRTMLWVTSAIALALVVVILALAARELAPQSTTRVRRFAIDLPWQAMPNWGDFRARISPQGTHLAYPGSDENRTTIQLRPLDSLDPITLVSPSADPWNLAFSPDGERLAFFRNLSQLNIVSIRGGQPERIFDLPPEYSGEELSWGGDGTILIGVEGGLFRVSVAGGDSEFIPAPAETDFYLSPFFLPDGRRALVSIVRRGEAPRLAVVDLGTAALTELPLQGLEPIYSPTGHILFRQSAALLAARFDIDSLEVLGQAREIENGVAYGPRLSDDGTLVYVAERLDGTAGLVWVDREGNSVPVGGERRDYTHIDLSSDGTQALLNVADREIYAYDIGRGSSSLVVSDTLADFALFPLWHPDGELATFLQGSSIYTRLADGSGRLETLVDRRAVPTSWSPSGEILAFFDRQSDIWISPLNGESESFVDGPNNERSGRFSPDGSALAYVSDELGGEFQVYVTPFPGPGRRQVVSIDGGLSPLWSADGDELYFRQGSKVMAARISLGSEIMVSPPVELFDGPYTLDLSGHQRYDVAPDGRFLMVENSEDFRVVVVEKFFEELNRLVPTN